MTKDEKLARIRQAYDLLSEIPQLERTKGTQRAMDTLTRVTLAAAAEDWQKNPKGPTVQREDQ